MAVQDPQAPCGEHQQPGAGKKDAHQLNGELAFLPVEAGCDGVDEPGRRDYSKGDEHSGGDEQQAEDRFGDFRGFLVAVLGVQTRINRNE